MIDILVQDLLKTEHVGKFDIITLQWHAIPWKQEYEGEREVEKEERKRYTYF